MKEEKLITISREEFAELNFDLIHGLEIDKKTSDRSPTLRGMRPRYDSTKKKDLSKVFQKLSSILLP
jgi:hypothetical protein